jgi:3-deoxy-manno-octulosonate cytidylyltransferase (CMP-KDO synthetase)
MIEHVFARTAACARLDDVLIATCDEEIALAASGFGATSIMTSAAHVRATDRIAEACERNPADIIVMVQGDEPMIRPDMVSAAITPLLENSTIGCVNLAAPIRTEAELRSPNTIKVVISRQGTALYFSREVIPTIAGRRFRLESWYKQVCIIAFRRHALRKFPSLPPGPLEIDESIDMLRFLENCLPVHIVMTDAVTHAVDTPADLELVELLMADAPSCFPMG